MAYTAPFHYPAPDHTVWRNGHQRRNYRRQRVTRHQRYLSTLSWYRSALFADIEQRRKAGRCVAEEAWILDEELARWFGHRRPRHGMCECEHVARGAETYWWPFPEAEWEPQPEDTPSGT